MIIFKLSMGKRKLERGINQDKKENYIYDGNIFLSFVLLVGRLSYLQLIKGEELKKKAFSQWTRERLVAPKRGSIVDRNGKILAMSITAETVVASLSQVKDKEYTARVLSGILGMDYEKILKNSIQKEFLTFT